MATDTKNPGDKTLSVSSKTLTLKPRAETLSLIHISEPTRPY